MKHEYSVNRDAAKRTCNGIEFASELEMRFYRDMVLPDVESGRIIHLELQKPYILQAGFKRNGKAVLPITYVSDFYIIYEDGSEVVIDTKGLPDAVAKLKRKMFWYKYPDIDYRWITYSKQDGGYCDYDYVTKQRKLRKAARKEKEHSDGRKKG